MARQSERRKGKAGQEDDEFDPNFVLCARKQEQLLIDVLPELAGERVICNTVGRAQFAETYAHCARLRPCMPVPGSLPAQSGGRCDLPGSPRAL